MIKNKLLDMCLLGSVLLGCAIAAPYVACMLVKAELRARM